jgi:hypothetical protein
MCEVTRRPEAVAESLLRSLEQDLVAGGVRDQLVGGVAPSMMPPSLAVPLLSAAVSDT